MGPDAEERIVLAQELRRFGEEVLMTLGVQSDDAHLVADSLVQAELWGHRSHGMLRLPWYVARLRSGVMNSFTPSRYVIDRGSLVVIDGMAGIGQVLAMRAVMLGVERARTHGISGVAVRDSNHFGTAAYFTRKAAEAGCIALLFTNASPAMAPWGGRTKTIGTNPWSIAAPAGRHGVAVMDLANTAVARGKIYLAAEEGTEIPEGWAADANGVPTTDPLRAIEGLIQPMAGPKGYVMAFMIDVLAGVLTGSAFGEAVTGPYVSDSPSGCGHLVLTIDVGSIADPEEYARRIEQLIVDTKSVETADGFSEILFPGELEDQAERIGRAGIGVAHNTWESLLKLAEEMRVRPPARTARPAS